MHSLFFDLLKVKDKRMGNHGYRADRFFFATYDEMTSFNEVKKVNGTNKHSSFYESILFQIQLQH